MVNRDPHDLNAPSPMHGQSDIRLNGWWHHLPRPLHPYIYLARLDRPIGWWLLLLPAWWIIPLAAPSPAEMVRLMLLFMLGAVVMRGGGCVVNDMWDRRIDLKVARTSIRPLAAGTVSLFQALIFLALLCVIGLYVLLQLPYGAWLVGIASLPLIIIYPLAKRVTYWPQFVLGLTFSWGVPLGWAAIYGDWPTVEIWVIYAGTVAWVFGYDTIYAVQDLADDAIVGVKSSALGLGQNLIIGTAIAFIITVALIGAGLYLHSGVGFWVIGLGGMAVHLAWQITKLRADDPAGAALLFKSNRNAGLLLTLGLIIDQILTAG